MTIAMSHIINLVSESPAETERIATQLAAHLQGGEIISLEGELGTGKTLCSRAICHALGVEGSVTSPTFLLQKIYFTGRKPVNTIIHYDFYRIGNYDELIDLGFEERDDETVVLAEWGEKFVEHFPVPPIRIAISGSGEDPRTIRIANAPPGYRPQ